VIPLYLAIATDHEVDLFHLAREVRLIIVKEHPHLAAVKEEENPPKRKSSYARDLKLPVIEKNPDKNFSLTEEEIGSLMKLFRESSCWKRLRCVQQVVHAYEVRVVCRHRDIPWAALPFLPKHHGCRNLGFMTDAQSQPIFGIFVIADELPVVEQAIYPLKEAESENLIQQFADLLLISNRRECSDIRDSIYALLSLPDFARSYIIPDYIKSIFEVSCCDEMHHS
jgi:hypothetical protein